jgi:hypothetical protein
MSQTSTRFQLPYIMPGQAQKHVTHNEVIRALDALLHVSAVSREVESVPTDPMEGESYILSAAPQDAFEGHAKKLAHFIDGGWMFHSPVQGLIANIEDEAICVIWRGDSWEPLTTGSGGTVDINTLSFESFGINGGADEYNRLVLNSAASLFNHNGAGHQLKINKATDADTGSLLFQTDFSSRAELGLAGDDDFSVKVSGDGTDFKTAITIERESGVAEFPNSPHLTQPVIFNMFGDGGRFGGKPEPLDVRLNGAFIAPNYITSFNGASLSEGDKYIDNSNNLGGNRGQMADHMVALATRFKPGASNTVLRYGTEFYTLSVTAGAGTGGALTLDGVTAYLAVAGLRFPMPPRYTLSFWIRVTSGMCLVGDTAQTQLMIDGTEIIGNTALSTNNEWHHIQRLVSYKSYQFLGYEANPYRLYATPGATFELAAPVLFPGNLATDATQPIGIVNALTAFM